MFSLAWKNITRRLGGSLMTALIAFIAVFVLATSLAVVASLENGLRLSRERLGADIMVLPAGASGNASEVLFCAEPVNVYLPADVERTGRNRRCGTGDTPVLHANGQPELLLGDRGDARGGH